MSIIDSGNNQFGHYIMFSDGLKIQSGHIEGHEQYLTIVFPKPFNTTSYNFTRTSTFTGRNEGKLEFAYQGALQNDRTNTSIKIYIGEYSYASDWIAIGY